MGSQLPEHVVHIFRTNVDVGISAGRGGVIPALQRMITIASPS